MDLARDGNFLVSKNECNSILYCVNAKSGLGSWLLQTLRHMLPLTCASFV